MHYRGGFYGEAGRGEAFPEGITVESLVAMIAALPLGVTELSCHPGDGESGRLPRGYGSPRAVELCTLVDPAVREALDALGVVLTTFAAVGSPR